MTARERVHLALAHKETDRIPIAIVCSGINNAARDAVDKYLRKKRNLGIDEYFESLIDIKNIAPDYIGPKLPSGTDIWGVHRKTVSYGVGEYLEIDYYPFSKVSSEEEIYSYNWPHAEFFNYSSLMEKLISLKQKGDFCLMVSAGSVFEASWAMRGFENMFIDLAVQPRIAHAIFEHVTAFNIKYITRILEAAKGEIDLVFLGDDIAGQNGLLMSYKMWEEHIKPYHSRLNKVFHEYGVKIMYHSDGAVMEAVPGLIDMGIDVLQALQFDAKGMDPLILKDKYGDRLCFEGGISVQSTLPYGTVEDVRNEVYERIRVLGRSGGYILGPSHVIQDGTPPENIVALFDTAANYKF